MQRRLHLRQGFAATAVALLLSHPRSALADAPANPDAVALPAAEVMRRAFEIRYGSDLTARVDLVMRDRHGAERLRQFEVAIKRINGRLHAIGRLVSPDYLRGMAIMTIDQPGRGSDAFVYLPSLGRTRRITTAQRSDAFLGSDLTYEDFGAQRVEEFNLAARGSARVDGEEVRVVRAWPRDSLSYACVEFLISERDSAILEARYFKREDDEPYRVIRSPRRSMRSGSGYVLPTRLTVENRLRGTTTEVVIRDLAINPKIDDREFSIWALERTTAGVGEAPQGP